MHILLFFLIVVTSATRNASDDLATKVEAGIESNEIIVEAEPEAAPQIILAPDAPEEPTTAPQTSGIGHQAKTEPDTANATGLVAEDQTPTGQFTTATEVKPILSMTKGSWVAVREYDGQDLVYFTNLLAWRCGVLQISYAINDGPEQVFDAEPCQLDYATPNAMIDIEGHLPYITEPLKSVETVTVHVIYDDLSEDTMTVNRKDVLTP